MMEERYHMTKQNRFYPDMSNVNKNFTVEAILISPPMYMYVCMYVRTYVRMYVCMYIYTHKHIYIYICMCVCVCVYIYISRLQRCYKDKNILYSSRNIALTHFYSLSIV